MWQVQEPQWDPDLGSPPGSGPSSACSMLWDLDPVSAAEQHRGEDGEGPYGPTLFRLLPRISPRIVGAAAQLPLGDRGPRCGASAVQALEVQW